MNQALRFLVWRAALIAAAGAMFPFQFTIRGKFSYSIYYPWESGAPLPGAARGAGRRGSQPCCMDSQLNRETSELNRKKS